MASITTSARLNQSTRNLLQTSIIIAATTLAMSYGGAAMAKEKSCRLQAQDICIAESGSYCVDAYNKLNECRCNNFNTSTKRKACRAEVMRHLYACKGDARDAEGRRSIFGTTPECTFNKFVFN